MDNKEWQKNLQNDNKEKKKIKKKRKSKWNKKAGR